jgi:hypothetical protein
MPTPVRMFGWSTWVLVVVVLGLVLLAGLLFLAG